MRKIRNMQNRKKTARATAAVTATDAAKNFGELIDRVRDAGAAYVVERKGRPIATIAPFASRRCTLADLARWFAGRRPTAEGYAGAVSEYVRKVNRPRVPATRWQP